MIAYFGHPKSGSTWLGGLMAGISRAMGLHYYYGQLSLPTAIPHDIIEQGHDVIISQNTHYDKVLELGTLRAFHVIRDPRDLLVSGYFSYLKTHPLDPNGYMARIRTRLEAGNKAEGILSMMDIEKRTILAMQTWDYTNPDILELKFEDITAYPMEEIFRIADHLKLTSNSKSDSLFRLISLYNRGCLRVFRSSSLQYRQQYIPSTYLEQLVNNLSFKKLSGKRKIGEESKSSYYRKSGDWKNHFTPKYKEVFLKTFGDVLIDLGYEKDDNW